MTGRLASLLRAQPVAENERRAAAVAVLAFVLCVFLLLHVPHGSARHSVRGHLAAPANPASTPASTAGVALRVVHGFLPGYLAYAYLGARAAKIGYATRALMASLEDHPPRVLPSRESVPKVIELRPAGRASGHLAVTAVLNDGGIIDYTLGLLLTRTHGRLAVARLESPR